MLVFNRFDLTGSIFRMRTLSPGVPVVNSPTVRNLRKSICTTSFHSLVSGSGRTGKAFLVPMAEMLRTYPENLAVGRIADRISEIRNFKTLSYVKKRFLLHSVLFSICIRILSRSINMGVNPITDFAFSKSIYKLSLKTDGASYKHLSNKGSRSNRKFLNFRYSINLNFRKLVSICQNVLTNLFEGLFDDFQVMVLNGSLPCKSLRS
jgi:hypothetical protein